ncbi:T6SS effector BTH_I2691 family protein [Vulcaniibacterium tengchongense]|uniref:Toxin VasX N-terminal region domain-containing protein n=1 Tax=Vulcaniibacterium tengchongense TaxID=1273429 RepID=A0A3N4V3M0_9GAMM|nr:T6SS effector BTH_I2691 family protein [Vulcaniibacterium tengchongense]RPE75865.1 hypothetical protein EDC50_2762 [Vulcaniibacterium tengchongense]
MAVSHPVARQGGAASRAIRANANAARNVAAGSVEGCPFCGRQGVPILPLRYAAIPNYLESRRGQVSPQALFGGRESALGEVPRMQRHFYTVRTLRQGYLYVYLNRPGQWQVYAVTPEGNLRLLADPDDIDEKAGREMSAQCKRSGDNIPASFIHIRDPKRTPVVWLAFSTARWSSAVRAQREKAPAARMQRFDVAKLDSNPDGEKDAFALDEGAARRLSGWVEEFIGEGETPTARQAYVSTAVGDVPSNRFVWESVHGFGARAGQAQALQEYARCYQQSRGQAHKVAAVVLHDAMGIVQELDASRAHSVETAQNYVARVARPLTVSQSILGLKKVIEQSTLAARTQDEQKRGIPDRVTESIPVLGPVPMYHPNNTYTTTRAERAAADSRRIWEDLAQHYDEAARAAFQSNYDKVMKAFADQTAMCDADWAAWAEHPSWQAWLDDYDRQAPAECARFTQDYAACLAGGVAGDKSLAVWKKWLEGRPDDPANPVYRALFFNHQGIVEHLMPQGGNLNKGDKLYDTLRGIAGSDEVQPHLSSAVKAAVASLQTALTGALARVEVSLEKAGGQLAESARDVALRAQQGAVLLYENVETTLLRVHMTVGEYQSLLSELAFRKADQIGQVAQEFVDQAGRKVRSLLKAGLLRIDDPKVRDTVVEVLVWSFEQAEDLQRQIAGGLQDVSHAASGLAGQAAAAADDVARAGSAFAATVSTEWRTIRLGAVLLSEQAAARLAGLRTGMRLSARQLAQLGRNVATRSLRVAGSGNLILAAGSLFFQGWSLRDSIKSMDRTLGSSGIESQLAVLSPAVGVVGASLETLGFAMDAAGKNIGKHLIKVGGVLAAGASAVDAVQSGFAATRTRKSGDRDASVWYSLATAAFFFGAAFGVGAVLAGSSVLLGPFGIALALIALGVISTWMALNAEDTQAEIWLDRCYFGKGARSEGKWTDAQVSDELAALNAILVGLSAKISFSDAWLGIAERISGYERIDVEIRIFGFEQERGAYEWRLYAQHEETRREYVTLGGRHRVPPPTLYVQAAPNRGIFGGLTRDESEDWFRGFDKGTETYEDGAWVIRDSVEVQRSRFQRARLRLDYWPDYADRSARASVELRDED